MRLTSEDESLFMLESDLENTFVCGAKMVKFFQLAREKDNGIIFQYWINQGKDSPGGFIVSPMVVKLLPEETIYRDNYIPYYVSLMKYLCWSLMANAPIIEVINDERYHKLFTRIEASI